jgi:hypothetical protein
MAENQRSGENQSGRNQEENRSDAREGRSLRGLASASKETRERVAREGGKASHGGGRKRGSTSSSSNTSGRE